MKIWVNGRLVASATPVVAATDPAVLYGFGLFEAMRAYGGVPFRLEDHLLRLRASARHFGLRVPHADLPRAIASVCRANRLPDAYIRLTLTGGGTLSVMARALDIPSPREYREGASIGVAPWRHDPRAPLFGHKTLNYLENVRTRAAGRAAGFADTLMLGPDDTLLEGCASNIFMVRGGDLLTPSTALHILPGVTRGVVLQIAGRLGLRTGGRRLVLADLGRADEVFITGSTMEIVPVARLGSKRVGGGRPGPVTRLLAMAYRSVVLTETR